MPRTIIAIEPGFEVPMTFRLLKAPQHTNGPNKPLPFNCDADDMPPWAGPNAVRARGERLLAELRNHSNVRDAIDNYVLAAPLGDVRSLYFHVRAPDAERLCWESLYDPQRKFLARNPRCPVARMADSEIDYPPVQYAFEPPLRFAALLSAAKQDAVPEWEQIFNSVTVARQKGLPIELLVLTGQSALQDAVNAARLAGADWVRLAPMPELASELQDAILDFRPHLLHCFCHGSADAGAAHLHFATALDEANGYPTDGSTLLDRESLADVLRRSRTWLAALNCCVGAAPTDDATSMAHRIVADGVPAAIGMAEPIDAADAHEFSRMLYPRLLQSLRERIAKAPPATPIEIEWADLLHPCREALIKRHADDPENQRQWILPVLYVRPEPFALIIAPGPAGRDDDLLGSIVARPPAVEPFGPAPAPAPADSGAPPSGADPLDLAPPAAPMEKGIDSAGLPLPIPASSRVQAFIAEPSDMERLNQKAQLVAGLLRNLPLDTPDFARDEFYKILDDVPQGLRPDKFGNFAAAHGGE